MQTSISDSPQAFMRKVQMETNVKTLLNMHRILHAWLAELRSSSPTKSIGENGWTPRWIGPAHDLVVRRIMQLDPAFKHDSPITAGVTYPPLSPMMLIPEFVSIVGSRVKEGKGPGESDLDVVVKQDEVDESLDVRLAKTLGEGIHVIYDARGPHDEAPFYEPLYHLVLMPVSEWRERQSDHLAAAMKEFDELVSPVRESSEYGYRVTLGAALVRSLIPDATSVDQAREYGRDAAFWVYGSDAYPRESIPLWGRLERSLKVGLGEAQQEATRIYTEEMMPIEDIDEFDKGKQSLLNQLGRLVDEEVVTTRPQLMMAARRLGREVATAVKEKDV